MRTAFLAGFAGGVFTLLAFLLAMLYLAPPVPSHGAVACGGPQRSLVVYVKDERPGATDMVWQRYVARPDPEWRAIRKEALTNKETP